MQHATNLKTDEAASGLEDAKNNALTKLTMFTEHYLSMETPASSKMNLELTSAWNCTAPVC